MNFHLFLTISLTMGWIIFGLIWFFTTPKSMNKWQIYFGKDSLVRQYIKIIGIGLILISALNFPLPAHETDPYLIGFGIFFYFAGFILAVWAKQTMKEYWNAPAKHNTQKQTKLLTTGPFAISRNPIYTGLILMFFGYGLTLKSIFVILTLVFYFFVLKIVKQEELILQKNFGKKYLDYKSRVPRFLGIKEWISR